MKKTLLIAGIASSMAFYACTKTEDVVTTVTPPNETVVIDTTPVPVKIDPVALSANLQVGYGGTATTGTFPAASASADAPVLDSIYNNRQYYAVKNRYVIIYPRTTTGFIQGYYLMVNGAGTYFKIDYGVFLNNLRKKQGARVKGHNSLRENGGHEDSSIVIKLPANVVGDTFKITYAAYDNQNRVSKPLNAIVSVIGSKDASDDAKVIGNWQETAYKYNNDEWQHYDYQNASFTTLYCKDNKLSYDEDVTATAMTDQIIESSEYQYYWNFTTNNTYSKYDIQVHSTLNFDSSSCSHLIYNEEQTKYPGDYTNGYTYNAATKQLTLISDESGMGQNIYTTTFTVKELTATKAIIFQAYPQNNGSFEREYYELTKTASK
jgi:hypothetical protein